MGGWPLEKGAKEAATARGLGARGRRGEALCVVCVNLGDSDPPICRPMAHPHRTPTSLAAPGLLLMCAPQGRAVGRCGFRAAPPRPRRRHRRDKEPGGLAPARPQGAPRLSRGGRRRSPVKRRAIHFYWEQGDGCRGAGGPG